MADRMYTSAMFSHIEIDFVTMLTIKIESSLSRKTCRAK